MKKNTIKIDSIFVNEQNPRFIKDNKFNKLVKSLSDFPKMMTLRPIIIDDNKVIVGGNMRYKALIHLGYKEIPENWIKYAKDFTEDELRRFVIADNVNFGEHDYDELKKNWNVDELDDWGIDTFIFETESDIDYDLLNDSDMDKDLEDMQQGVKKAIQIPFDLADYGEATEIYKYWRDSGAYVGRMFIDYLKQEKNKL